MFFSHKGDGSKRYGTVIAALGIDPEELTPSKLALLEKEFGCSFERGQMLIWIECEEHRAEQIFDILRRRNFLKNRMGESR
jgi:hypothetical protein